MEEKMLEAMEMQEAHAANAVTVKEEIKQETL